MLFPLLFYGAHNFRLQLKVVAKVGSVRIPILYDHRNPKYISTHPRTLLTRARSLCSVAFLLCAIHHKFFMLSRSLPFSLSISLLSSWLPWLPLTKGISYEIPVNEFVTFLMKLNNNYYNKYTNWLATWGGGNSGWRTPCGSVEWEQNVLFLFVFFCTFLLLPLRLPGAFPSLTRHPPTILGDKLPCFGVRGLCLRSSLSLSLSLSVLVCVSNIYCWKLNFNYSCMCW